MKDLLLLFTLATATALPSTVLAATRAGANYSMVAEATDAGGRRVASASYANDGSIGGIGGISSVASPTQTAKHSYIGQLYDTSGLVLSASPTNVDETSTRQLAARAVFDDGTTSPLLPGSVGWSVAGGPLVSISTAGLATAGVVYQNTIATAAGIYQGKAGTLSLLVLDVLNDNYGSYAGDGLPDWWQAGYFGIGNANAAPGRDPDGDGQTNYFEYVANTIPTDSNSLFRLRIDRVSGKPAWKNLVFSPRYASRTYTPLYRTSIAGGTWAPLIGTVGDAGSERTVTDLDASGDTKFYRVQITVP